eukprot:9362643-Alexandrium_andersonii.AAC.1
MAATIVAIANMMMLMMLVLVLVVAMEIKAALMMLMMATTMMQMMTAIMVLAHPTGCWPYKRKPDGLTDAKFRFIVALMPAWEAKRL